jgi:hypothetical protein
MTYKHTNKYDPSRLGDHIIYCDICGMPTWYSESKVLEVYTGKGGLLVCPDDADVIDYGLVPYTIPPESIVETTRINETFATSTPETTYPPFNTGELDPMSYSSPNDAIIPSENWEGQTNLDWDQLNMYPWEQMK